MTSRWIETWSLFLSADGSVVSLFPKCLGTWMIFHYISFEYRCWKKNNSKMSGVNVNKIKYHVNIENKRMYWEILMLIFEPWAIFSPRCCVVYFFAFPYGACLMCTRGMLISASLSRFLQVLMDWLGVNSSVLWFFSHVFPTLILKIVQKILSGSSLHAAKKNSVKADLIWDASVASQKTSTKHVSHISSH